MDLSDLLQYARAKLSLGLFAVSGTPAATSAEDLRPGILDAATNGLLVTLAGMAEAASDPSKPWFVRGVSDLGVAERLATYTEQFAQTGYLDDLLATALDILDALESPSSYSNALWLALLDRLPTALSNGRLRVDTTDARPRSPVVGNGVAEAAPGKTQLETFDFGTLSPNSEVGWLVTNESPTLALRLGGANVNNTIGHLIGPGQTSSITSSTITGWHVSGLGGPVTVSIRGEFS